MTDLKYNRAETIDYLQSMLAELLEMAKSQRCEVLAFLIEMAYMECQDISSGNRPFRHEHERHERKMFRG